MRYPRTKQNLPDKGKIIDLWKRKRQQIKHKKRRNLLRRVILIFAFLLINGGLISFAYLNGSPTINEALEVKGLLRYKSEEVTKSLNLKPLPLWLFRFNSRKLIAAICKQNPLIEGGQTKTILWPDNPRLEIVLREDLPWARFESGWILAYNPESGKARILKGTKKLNLNKVAFASRVLLESDEADYVFFAKRAKTIQRLIFSASLQLPEKPLEKIVLKKDEPIILYFPNMQVSLGNWDEQLLERVSRLSSTLPTLKKYENQPLNLDLSNNSRAILKLNAKWKEKTKE
jgi:hypothetical protein